MVGLTVPQAAIKEQSAYQKAQHLTESSHTVCDITELYCPLQITKSQISSLGLSRLDRFVSKS